MSEQRQDTGSPSDRRMSTANALATGAGVGLTIGMCDWLILQCFAGGQFHWVAPSQNLIEVGAPILVLPVALWFGRVVTLIGQIILDHLQKDAVP